MVHAAKTQGTPFLGLCGNLVLSCRDYKSCMQCFHIYSIMHFPLGQYCGGYYSALTESNLPHQCFWQELFDQLTNHIVQSVSQTPLLIGQSKQQSQGLGFEFQFARNFLFYLAVAELTTGLLQKIYVTTTNNHKRFLWVGGRVQISTTTVRVVKACLILSC